MGIENIPDLRRKGLWVGSAVCFRAAAAVILACAPTLCMSEVPATSTRVPVFIDLLTGQTEPQNPVWKPEGVLESVKLFDAEHDAMRHVQLFEVDDDVYHSGTHSYRSTQTSDVLSLLATQAAPKGYNEVWLWAKAEIPEHTLIVTGGGRSTSVTITDEWSMVRLPISKSCALIGWNFDAWPVTFWIDDMWAVKVAEPDSGVKPAAEPKPIPLDPLTMSFRRFLNLPDDVKQPAIPLRRK